MLVWGACPTATTTITTIADIASATATTTAFGTTTATTATLAPALAAAAAIATTSRLPAQQGSAATSLCTTDVAALTANYDLRLWHSCKPRMVDRRWQPTIRLHLEVQWLDALL